ncbi:carboxypeptidase-like regulatory domain-containing protein [Ulvibacterium sp.]|uniref:carboxypeptidase-like regulatory domain-containing protein n=1 Tax=Ulvibacterium sp. TaxID=2665914 RepID=UPI002629103F|nr:carboxypeptidase-like regulatory domain-containing protein [Ulvibacterium sp.]
MPKDLSIYIVYGVFLLLSLSLPAQESGYIVGKLVDATTNDPVVFANIRIKDRALGVITNEDGSFRIPLRYKEYGDILEISSMGYRTRDISIANLEAEKLNLIRLNPDAIVLDEAIVKAKGKRRNYSAYSIVKMAIEAIPENYPSNSFSTVGYYRDYQWKNGNYLNLNEAILEVFDQGFDREDFRTSEVRLFDAKMNKDFERDTLASQKYDYSTGKKIIDKAYLENYEGNEFTNLRIHDALRNFDIYSYDYVGKLEEDFLANHKFSKNKETYLGNEILHVIDGNGQKPGYRAHVRLYISKADYAIHKMAYTLYDTTEKNTSGIKNKHGHKRKVIFDVLVEYSRFNEKMYLNYISFHNSFRLNLPPLFEMTTVDLSLSEGHFGLKFNRPVDPLYAKIKNNYTITFKGVQWEVGKVEVFKDSVKVYPDLKEGILSKTMREIDVAVKKRTFNSELLDIKVKDVKDFEGNLVNTPRVENYMQFREFFVQRVKLKAHAPFDIEYMDKRKPLFENQPIERPKDYKEYWMNTPLLEKIN